VKVARQITEYNAKLALTDAYGKGLFYECIGFTGANDPGPGKLARNAAAWSDTTEIYMDVLDAGGHEQGALIDLARAGTAYIVRAIDTGAYAAFMLSGAPSNMGPDEWRKISLEYVDGDGIIADGELVAVEWNRKGEQGDSFAADAEVDTLAERDAFDDEAAGFVLKVNDVGDGRAAFFTMGTGGSADWGAPAYLTGTKGDQGDPGDKGWSPKLVGVSDGERRVLMLDSYVGGAGVPPTANVGEYLKADGTFTADIAEAENYRGPPGINGEGTVAGIGAGAGIEVDDADPANPVVSSVAFTGDGGTGGELGAVPAPAAGDAAAGKVLGAGGGWVNIDLSPPRGHIFGLITSNNVSNPNTRIDLAAGECASDATTPTMLVLASSLTKRLDANWAVGNDQGGLDTGSKAPNTWYYKYIIGRSDTGVVDALFSASATSPTLPGSYDQKRRIAAVRTDSSGNIIPYRQFGDDFFFVTTILDVSETALSTSRVVYPLTVPPKTKALVRAYVWNASGNGGVVIQPVFEADGAASASNPPLASLWHEVNSAGSAAEFAIMTDGSSSLAARATKSSTNFKIVTRGWVDRRGSDA